MKQLEERIESNGAELRAARERIKQLEDLEGGAKVSEGADAGYMDMANYALFALIHLESA